jgi:hypothetical protein
VRIATENAGIVYAAPNFNFGNYPILAILAIATFPSL